MTDFNEVARSRSISDDDLCATCTHLDYQPGETSVCKHPTFTPDWVAQSDENGYVQVCDAYASIKASSSAGDLTVIEENQILTHEQGARLVELAESSRFKLSNK